MGRMQIIFFRGGNLCREMTQAQVIRGQIMSNQHKKFYGNVVWQYGLQIVKYIFPFVTLPYLTRTLLPEGYAVYAYVVSFMTFAQTFVEFGFNLSGTKQVVDAHDSEVLGRVTGSITQARLTLCVLTGAVCAFIGAFIPIMRENVLYASLAYIAVCGRALAPDFLFQGKEQMAPITTRYLISKGASTILTFVFVHSMADILWVPILDIIASAIALAWSFSSARKMFGLRIEWVPPRVYLRELARSAYYCISNMSSTAFSGFITLLIGIAIKDPVQISYWSLSMTAINAVQALYSPITNSLYPHMVAQGDFGFARRLAFISVPFVFGGTVLFFVLSEFIMLLLGGVQYLSGAYVLRLVAPVLIFSFYGMFFGWPVLGAVGKVKELTATTLVSSLVSVVVLVIITGSGMASVAIFAVVRSLTEALMCTLRLNECRKAFNSCLVHK